MTGETEPIAESELYSLSHERHPLTTMLRQYAIQQTIEKLHATHHPIVNKLMVWAGQEIKYGGEHAKGLCIKGSAMFPPNVRASGDLDITVNMGMGYDIEGQRKAFAPLMKLVARLNGATMFEGNLSSPLYKDSMRRLQQEKALSLVYHVHVINRSQWEGMKKYLKKRGAYSDEDFKPFDGDWKNMIEEIIAERKETARKYGTTYDPLPEEEKGTGLAIVTAIELTAKDRLNIFSSTYPGKSEGAQKDRTSARLEQITFVHALEEAADKFFALFTSQERAMVDEPHAKDLVDFYLHTKGTKIPYPSMANTVVPYRSTLMDTVRVLWPAHPAFHQTVVYFKKTDPSLTKSVKNVANGLLKLKAHGIITRHTFGEEITEANAEKYAGIIMNNAWEFATECFGLERGGSQNHPSYTLNPKPHVKEYWDACRAIPKKVEKKLSKPEDDKRAGEIEAELRQRIKAMGEGIYGTPRDFEVVQRTGATNAYVNADKSRSWKGFKGIS